MFMLNLLFDLNDDDGVFVPSNRHTLALEKSKYWLKLDGPEPAGFAGFDPESPLISRTKVGDSEAASLQISTNQPTPPVNPPLPDEGNIGIRIVPEGSFVLAGAKLSLSVCFGRPPMRRTSVASPFEFAAGIAKTTFIELDLAPNTTAGWFYYVGLVNRPNGNKHHPRRFEYSVGVIVEGKRTAASSVLKRTYSLDPEMDVGPDP